MNRAFAIHNLESRNERLVEFEDGIEWVLWIGLNGMGGTFMRKNWTLIACGVALAAANICLEPSAVARPEYNKEFWDMYPPLKEQREVTKCYACHGEEKKFRNDYGKAIGRALGGSKVKNAARIKDALKKAENEKSATDGKTFGDLLKDGKLPGKAR